MGYKMIGNGKVKRTLFPKTLTKAQIKQMDDAKSNTVAVNRAVAATKRVNFRGLAASV